MTYDIDQRSPEWHELRAKRVGGSEAHYLLMHPDLKAFPVRAKKLLEKKMRGEVDTFQGNAATRRGLALEWDAIAAYENYTGFVKCERVGYVAKGDLFGCSPDAIGTVKGSENISPFLVVVEIKCPLPENYEAQANNPPIKHVDQIYWNMWVTGIPKGDLIYYLNEDEYMVHTFRWDRGLGVQYQELITRRTAQYEQLWHIFNP